MNISPPRFNSSQETLSLRESQNSSEPNAAFTAASQIGMVAIPMIMQSQTPNRPLSDSDPIGRLPPSPEAEQELFIREQNGHFHPFSFLCILRGFIPPKINGIPTTSTLIRATPHYVSSIENSTHRIERFRSALPHLKSQISLNEILYQMKAWKDLITQQENPIADKVTSFTYYNVFKVAMERFLNETPIANKIQLKEDLNTDFINVSAWAGVNSSSSSSSSNSSAPLPTSEYAPPHPVFSSLLDIEGFFLQSSFPESEYPPPPVLSSLLDRDTLSIQPFPDSFSSSSSSSSSSAPVPPPQTSQPPSFTSFSNERPSSFTSLLNSSSSSQNFAGTKRKSKAIMAALSKAQEKELHKKKKLEAANKAETMITRLEGILSEDSPHHLLLKAQTLIKTTPDNLKESLKAACEKAENILTKKKR